MLNLTLKTMDLSTCIAQKLNPNLSFQTSQHKVYMVPDLRVTLLHPSMLIIQVHSTLAMHFFIAMTRSFLFFQTPRMSSKATKARMLVEFLWLQAAQKSHSNLESIYACPGPSSSHSGKESSARCPNSGFSRLAENLQKTPNNVSSKQYPPNPGPQGDRIHPVYFISSSKTTTNFFKNNPGLKSQISKNDKDPSLSSTFLFPSSQGSQCYSTTQSKLSKLEKTPCCCCAHSKHSTFWSVFYPAQ